jgi:hypothetical protein
MSLYGSAITWPDLYRQGGAYRPSGRRSRRGASGSPREDYDFRDYFVGVLMIIIESATRLPEYRKYNLYLPASLIARSNRLK